MSFANYGENAVLNHIFKVAAMTVPTNLYVALHTADPTETGAVGEVSGNGYERKVFNTWTTATTGSLSNNGAVTFVPANGGAWGTISYFSIWDSLSGGNCIGYGAVGVPKSVADGDVAEFASGQITISLD